MEIRRFLAAGLLAASMAVLAGCGSGLKDTYPIEERMEGVVLPEKDSFAQALPQICAWLQEIPPRIRR